MAEQRGTSGLTIRHVPRVVGSSPSRTSNLTYKLTMTIQEIEIGLIKPNPNNPRTIKDAAFKDLVKSITEFPEMLKVRPIVLNKEMIVIGGSRRFDACKAAGLTHAPCLIADHFTPEQEREFVIKDNLSAGEWDFEMLTGPEWAKADDWGLSFPAKRTKKPKEESDAEGGDICPTCGK